MSSNLTSSAKFFYNKSVSPKMEALNPQEIEERIKALPNWKIENNALFRSQTFPNYLDALEFVYKVGHAAEEADHHPDIFMNYKRVTVRYWTHRANGVTELDFRMAEKVEKLVEETYRSRH
ncbi:MAG: 4a-hydroxytetrahydrobiopterin dehydratase [Elusimicrobia bacterium]|nr:4a-hydroxytetrahydrobiopterin dehydratase [Elusimicrobiota bacterium]